MKKSILLSCTAAFFILTKSAAQTIHPKLDSLLRVTLNDQRILLNVKGLGAAIQFSNGNIWAGASGISSQLPNVSMDTTQVFGIASITKTVTAACVLQMADEGLLQLDDSLHEWLDTFQYINPNITIRQLLRHQSGIYDVLSAPSFQNILYADPDSIWQLADVVETFIAPPYFQPGAAWRYSNTNYLLLGMIVEKVAGQPYQEVFRDRFLDPKGLASFSMQPFEPLQNYLVHAWIDLNGDGTVDDAHSLLSNWHSFDAATAPAGSYYATPSDLARWIRAFAGGSLLSPGMMAQAKTTVATAFPANTRYGLGLMERTFLTHKAFGHGGDSGYSGSAWYFPDLDQSIVVLNNDASKNSWQIAPAVQALLKTYLDYEATLAAPLVEHIFQVKASPNPFSNEISLSCSLPVDTDTLEWTLSNQLGVTVLAGRSPAFSGNTFETKLQGSDQLSPGLYYLQCFVGGARIAVQKVLKSDS